MNISVVGTGYVGLVCGAGFAEMGNTVVCVDADADKVAKLRRGVIPIYEPGLEEVVRENTAAGHLSFTTDIREAITKTDICFIAVGTPMGEDGGADLVHVLAVAKDVGRHMDRHMVVVDKSTVPVGTADRVRACIAEELERRGVSLTFDVVSNPEFLKEGMALSDFMKPDRVILGVDDERPLAVLQELYAPFTMKQDNIIVMDIRSAEMTKYAANAMLATKISFINEMAAICERVGADVDQVRVGVGSDPRIGYHFIYPGCGYGGSCLPKDVRALARTAVENGHEPALLHAVDRVNQAQKRVLVDKVRRRFGEDLRGMVFAIWGLAFKPDTDDMREAPAIDIVGALTDMGARIRAYDPKATEAARDFHFRDNPAVMYAVDKYEALADTDAMLLLTDWKEFRSPDFSAMRDAMRHPVIFDGRNQYDRKRMAEMGFEYHRVGVRTGGEPN